MSVICPFCKCDPFHYVDNGIGFERVAITCCEAGIDLFGGGKNAKAARRALRDMRNPSPRAKARAKRWIETGSARRVIAANEVLPTKKEL
jgi:hypothetical protein